MSRLFDAVGAEFATGQFPCFTAHAMPGDRLNRLFVYVRVGGTQSPAVVDTGGALLVIDPQLATTVGVDRRKQFPASASASVGSFTAEPLTACR